VFNQHISIIKSFNPHPILDKLQKDYEYNREYMLNYIGNNITSSLLKKQEEHKVSLFNFNKNVIYNPSF